MRYTRIEKEALRLQKCLRPLTQKALQWIESKHVASAIYAKSGRVWCTRCGHIERLPVQFLALDIETGYCCPNCKAKLRMRHDAHSRYETSSVFAVVPQVVNGWQVFRCVESVITTVFGEQSQRDCHEVWQAWISPQGREVLLSRKYSRAPYSFHWHYDTPIECPRRHAAMLRKKAAQEAEKRIAEDNKLYKEAKKPFFDIEIAADGLRLIVLPDVEAFHQEGKALSHCVYSNRYFERQDALILSARDEENNPVETIEVSLKTFEIVQSRGRSNQPSSRHAEIVDIVKRNMNLIKERATL